MLWETPEVRSNADWIEDLRIELRARDNRALADLLGIDYERLRNAIKGRSEKGFEEVSAIASKLLKRAWPETEVRTVQRVPLIRVPIVGLASAGSGTESGLESDEVWVPSTMVPDSAVAWPAVGDSMMPWIQPGDIVLATPQKEPRSGYAMLVRTQEGEVLVKKVAWSGGKFVLKSLNPTYPDVPATVEWLGLVTGIYISRGTYERAESDLHGLRPPEF